MVNLSKFSLYKTVGVLIVSTVVIVISLYSSYSYFVVKDKIIKQMQADAQFTIQSHEKNFELLISSYSIHEYDALIRNHMEQGDFLAIVVEDNKMGQILGVSPYISGFIRDQHHKVVEFNPKEKSHLERLQNAFFSIKHKITTSSGDELGSLKIYISGDILNTELDNLIVSATVNAIILSILLTLVLFTILRLIVLKPLNDLNGVITTTDEDGIPSHEIPKNGTLEMVTLASAMEKMISTIKATQSILKDEQIHLAESESQLLLMLELSPIAVRISTVDGHNVVFANRTYAELIHKNRDDVIGQNPQNYYRDSSVYDTILNRLSHDETIYNEIVELMVDGEQLWVLASYAHINFEGIPSVLGWFYNITDQKEAEFKLQYTSNHDALTGLPNRTLLSSLIPQILARCKRNNTYAALLFIDLDGFKKINDDYGHQAGDDLLKDVATRLNSLVRGDDIVSRLGGDEFTIVIGELNSSNEVISLAHRILYILNEPFNYAQSQLYVSASIGISFYPQNIEVDADTLLRQADQAMYEAKLRGKNQFAFYDEIYNISNQNTTDYASEISAALKNEEFILFYQPKVQMTTGIVMGAEALIRWNDPLRGMVYPDDFLPIIENRPLIYTLDQWVFNKAVSQLSEWNKNSFTTKISINLSAYSLKQVSLMDFIESTLERYSDVLPSQIEIEILETSALHDIVEIQNVIEQFHIKGITVALDDFGTGYSTLSYLKKLKIDYLKLDKSFVIDMLSNTSDLSILDATLGLANAFNFKVIAEGVESIEHGNLLIQFGCDYAQGYAIARPMAPETFVEWIKGWESDSSWTLAQKISTTLIPLVYASVAHRSWFNKLENYWNKKEDFSPNSGESECQFGNWLIHHGQNFFNEEEYTRIQEMHHYFHDRAFQLANCSDEGTREILWSVIYSIHNDLLKMLEQKIFHLNDNAKSKEED